jgi:hypothetical protein
MTWLTVSRPPNEPDEARRLAVEHHALAEHTFVTPSVELRQHVHLLPHLDRWVLFRDHRCCGALDLRTAA